MLKRSLALFILLQPHIYVSRSTIFTNHAHAALCRVFNASSASTALPPPSSLPYHHTRSHYLLLRARTRRFNKLGSRHALSRMSLCAPWPNSRTRCYPRPLFSTLSPKTLYPRVLDHTPTLPVCLILIRTSHYPSLCACTRQFDELHSRHPASAVENGRAPLVRICAPRGSSSRRGWMTTVVLPFAQLHQGSLNTNLIEEAAYVLIGLPIGLNASL